MKQPITIICISLLAIVVAACNPKSDSANSGKMGSGHQTEVVNPDAAKAGTNLSNATMPGGPGTGVSAEPTTTASGTKDKDAK